VLRPGSPDILPRSVLYPANVIDLTMYSAKVFCDIVHPAGIEVLSFRLEQIGWLYSVSDGPFDY